MIIGYTKLCRFLPKSTDLKENFMLFYVKQCQADKSWGHFLKTNGFKN
jgi:hypothetical protein